jgi:hypothetical protein
VTVYRGGERLVVDVTAKPEVTWNVYIADDGRPCAACYVGGTLLCHGQIGERRGWYVNRQTKTGIRKIAVSDKTIGRVRAQRPGELPLLGAQAELEDERDAPPGDASIGGTDISAHLAATHATFAKWLGARYDIQALDAVLAAAAAVEFPGDPPWLLVVGGSGAAKTETLMPLMAVGAMVVSTISGEAALLSGTPTKERASDANGGILRKLGASGLLVVKDVTSILSMNRDTRSQVLAALREIYDGRWHRDVGSEGGRRLTWQGRLVVVGAVTTAWDQAHTVIASMGDRFVLVRIDAGNRRAAGLQALRNVDHEPAMRSELADAVGSLIKSARKQTDELVDAELLAVLDRADLVTRARTGVERDYSGNVICAHAAEMPTRFAKQLAQLMRGGMAIGMTATDAFEMMLRCAADSVPPLRLAVLGDVAAHQLSRTTQVGRRLQLPRRTVDRVLQELHLLGLLRIDEEPRGESVRWLYSLDASVDTEVLSSLAKVRRNVSTP